MDRTERFYRITRLLQGRRSVSASEFLEVLEVSRATFKRDIEYLRSRMGVPIVWDPSVEGYRLHDRARETELPGLWFSAAEAHALLTMHQLLEQIDPGVLDPHLKPIARRLESLLGSRGHAADEVRQRIRILHAGRRRVPTTMHFEVLSSALLARKRTRLRHFNRGTGVTAEREVSPQRLAYYRDNWYLDAWCHLRDGLRSFSVDAIEQADVLDVPAIDVPEVDMARELAAGYGIFSGSTLAWAVLRFTAERSRWVAAEDWHPDQRARFEADGRYLLEVPYSDPRELLMDVLKHGADVEVLAPTALRTLVRTTLAASLGRYSGADEGAGSPSEPGGR